MNKKTGVKISQEWSGGQISVSKKSQNPVKKLRDKIFQHVESTAHKTAVKVLDEQRVDRITKSFAHSSQVIDAKTEANFRTANMIAKERVSFKKMTPVVSLQQQNSVIGVLRIFHLFPGVWFPPASFTVSGWGYIGW